MVRRKKSRRKKGVAAVVAARTEYGFSATYKATVKTLLPVQCKTN